MRQLEFPENIQAIVGGKEYSLDNAVLKIWPESEETKGALCVEMEGVGLFTIANYRKCVATGIYVVSDVYSENDWKLGWEGNDIKRAVGAVIDMIIESISHWKEEDFQREQQYKNEWKENGYIPDYTIHTFGECREILSQINKR